MPTPVEPLEVEETVIPVIPPGPPPSSSVPDAPEPPDESPSFEVAVILSEGSAPLHEILAFHPKAPAVHQFSGRASANGVDVPQGYHTLMCLGEEDSRGTDGEVNDLIVTCDPSEPEPIEDFGESWCFLEQLPVNIMNYQIERDKGSAYAPLLNSFMVSRKLS